jgi:hypothetical protein
MCRIYILSAAALSRQMGERTISGSGHEEVAAVDRRNQMFANTRSPSGKSMLMSLREDLTDHYADLQKVSDQLARLLAVYPAPLNQQERDKLNNFLSRLEHHLNHPAHPEQHPGAANAKDRIDAECHDDNPRPNRHKIGTELMRIAGAVDGCSSAADDAASLADDAVQLAAKLAPALVAL